MLEARVCMARACDFNDCLSGRKRGWPSCPDVINLALPSEARRAALARLWRLWAQMPSWPPRG